MQGRPTLGRVTALVEDLVAQKGTPRPVQPADRLVDVGLTSMDMVNLMLAIEAEFDVTIPGPEITAANFQSVAAIVALVGRVCPESAAA